MQTTSKLCRVTMPPRRSAPSPEGERAPWERPGGAHGRVPLRRARRGGATASARRCPTLTTSAWARHIGPTSERNGCVARRAQLEADARRGFQRRQRAVGDGDHRHAACMRRDRGIDDVLRIAVEAGHDEHVAPVVERAQRCAEHAADAVAAGATFSSSWLNAYARYEAIGNARRCASTCTRDASQISSTADVDVARAHLFLEVAELGDRLGDETVQHAVAGPFAAAPQAVDALAIACRALDAGGRGTPAASPRSRRSRAHWRSGSTPTAARLPIRRRRPPCRAPARAACRARSGRCAAAAAAARGRRARSRPSTLRSAFRAPAFAA